jgi:thioredoxin-like negative regulator of GroEL
MQDALVKMHSIEIVKINIDQEEEVAKAFNITAIPTAIFFDKGIVVKKAQGFIEVIDLLSEIGNNY